MLSLKASVYKYKDLRLMPLTLGLFQQASTPGGGIVSDWSFPLKVRFSCFTTPILYLCFLIVCSTGTRGIVLTLWPRSTFPLSYARLEGGLGKVLQEAQKQPTRFSLLVLRFDSMGIKSFRQSPNGSQSWIHMLPSLKERLLTAGLENCANTELETAKEIFL